MVFLSFSKEAVLLSVSLNRCFYIIKNIIQLKTLTRISYESS